MTSANVVEINSKITDPNNPEALFISALIDSGFYSPAVFSITDEYFGAWTNVHRFCTDYQEHANTAPPAHLVRSKFPSFPYMTEADPKWAAENLGRAHSTQTLHSGMQESIYLLREGKIAKAMSGLQDTLRTAMPRKRAGAGLLDEDLLLEADTVPSPVCMNRSDNLEKFTGGIRPGNLWYVAARLSVGKSWVLQQMAIAAAEGGWDVNMFSLEMTSKEVINRLHRIALRDVQNYYGLTMRERLDLMEQWQATNGRITVHDPSMGPVDAAVIAGSHDQDNPECVAIVDYVGLMRSTSGSRSIDDWRAAATISNELKEIALSHRIPIIAAAQINRAGANSEGGPKTEHMGQSDALGQDADVVVTLRRESRRVLLANLAKNRHGISGRRWNMILDPAKGLFGDISRDEALDLIEVDAAEEN